MDMIDDFEWGEEVGNCQCCGCTTPLSDLDEDGDCLDCSKNKDNPPDSI